MGRVDVWMPVYIGDYLRDTEELTGLEHGAYLLLLMHYWQKGGNIGCDISRLTRVCRADEETARFILDNYFILESGNYKNKRADEEMLKAESRRISAEENGRKGGRPPKNNPQETARLANTNQPVSQMKPDHNPTHNPQESSSSSSSQKDKEEDGQDNPTEEAQAMANLLYDLHAKNIDKGFKKNIANIKKWAYDIDKISRIDGRSWADIKAIITWVKTPGNFWASNVISGSKLREKFPTLIAQRKPEPAEHPEREIKDVELPQDFIDMMERHRQRLAMQEPEYQNEPEQKEPKNDEW